MRRLAVGGMGEVFLAQADDAAAPVVLKRVLPHLSVNKEFLDLFLHEARIASRIHHPNVARILELGDVGGSWYLVMEYVAGRDLREVTRAAGRKRKAVPVGLACRIAAGIAAGLDCAHKLKDAQGRPMQIVHRDVSPQNVLVSFDGAVKLIDFGVAKAAGLLAEDQTDDLMGKYPYMSPEQVAGETLDHRSDQFSLGILLWELLTGTRLFKGTSDAETMLKVSECAVPSPTRRDGPLPEPLTALVMQALEKEPRDRFSDLDALGGELEEILTSQAQAADADLAAFMAVLFPEGAQSERDSSPGGRSGSKPEESAAPVTPPRQTQAPAPPASPASAAELEAAWLQLQGYEQGALAQLSVFGAEFTLEAAEAVISLAAFPGAPWALDVVQALREKSMVRAWDAADAPGELRFALPDRVRTYALEKLKALGPDAERQARRRHAALTLQ